jgi:antitoxin component of RelBE/YafQ-DinJ toxin-antitoxin module
MAQLNIRVPDAEKEAADEVARSAGYGLGEYLGTIVAYIAAHRKLPIVIKFKPVAIKPEEVFQQAITKFRHAYLQISHLCQDVLEEGEMTPLESLRQPINDIDAAEAFYESHENQIALAIGQLERIVISEGENTMFARCREHFPYIPGFLRTAIRMVNMNNRAVSGADLEAMRSALQQAANHINILQEMVECDISADARSAFFVQDIEDAVDCATRATRPGESYLVSTAWKTRMDNHIHQADLEFQSLGVVKNLRDLALIWEKLRTLSEAVNGYLEHTSEPMRGLDPSNINEVRELISALKQYPSLPRR